MARTKQTARGRDTNKCKPSSLEIQFARLGYSQFFNTPLDAVTGVFVLNSAYGVHKWAEIARRKTLCSLEKARTGPSAFDKLPYEVIAFMVLESGRTEPNTLKMSLVARIGRGGGQ